MLTPPTKPKIYHITHVDNLTGIVGEGHLLSDAIMVGRGGPAAAIGMSTIKRRRLSLPVACHPAHTVGEFVPFYFCPRSVMLYVISKRNHPELTYRGGQEPIVHLEADLYAVVSWANRMQRAWAFSLSNAGARYAAFYASLSKLSELDWTALQGRDYRDPAVKEAKQAEFLLHNSFPWALVERVGVCASRVLQQCATLFASAEHKPRLEMQRSWYY